MKQCLSVLMILAAVAANAENNPFDLQENLQKIERAQSIFLDELKFLVQQKEASQKDEHEHGVFTEANTEENRSAAIETVQHIQTAAESSNLIEKETEDTQALNTEEKKPLLLKEEQAIKDQKIAKHEEEKKLLRLNEAEGKAEKEKSVTARIQDINISKERLEAKQNADKDYQEAVQEMDSEAQGRAEKEKSVTARIQDINISKEQLKAKQNADKDYQEAVQEMDGEK